MRFGEDCVLCEKPIAYKTTCDVEEPPCCGEWCEGVCVDCETCKGLA